jgi:hypothetical protein
MAAITLIDEWGLSYSTSHPTTDGSRVKHVLLSEGDGHLDGEVRGSTHTPSRWGSMAYGLMFWFTLKTLPGSYRRLTSTKRS